MNGKNDSAKGAVPLSYWWIKIPACLHQPSEAKSFSYQVQNKVELNSSTERDLVHKITWKDTFRNFARRLQDSLEEGHRDPVYWNIAIYMHIYICVDLGIFLQFYSIKRWQYWIFFCSLKLFHNTSTPDQVHCKTIYFVVFTGVIQHYVNRRTKIHVPRLTVLLEPHWVVQLQSCKQV